MQKKFVKYYLKKLNIPLKNTFITNKRATETTTSLLIIIQLNDGAVGVGEVAENEPLTGYSFSAIVFHVRQLLDKMIGHTLSSCLNYLANAERTFFSNYGIEIAIYDALARSEKISFQEAIGLKRYKEELTNDVTISIVDGIETRRQVIQAMEKGFEVLKLKLGAGSKELDRILSLQDYVPQKIRIRLDPNQSWSFAESKTNISKLESSNLNIEFIEQPIDAQKNKILKELTKYSNIPIVADEAMFSYKDAKKIIENHIADIINIKLIKCGGIRNAIKIANYANQQGVNCLFGCTTESNISITAAAILNMCLPNITYTDLDGIEFLEDTPFSGGIRSQGGALKFAAYNNLGLGISCLENKRQEYISDI